MTRRPWNWTLPLALALACGSGDEGPTAPRSITPYVRIVAGGVQGDLIREAEVAEATVRDSDPATGWQLPDTATTGVELDLQPWLGRAIRLHDLALRWSGAAPVTVDVTLSPACGSPGETLAWPDPSGPLALGDRVAGCVAVRIATQGSTRVTTLDLRTTDPGVVLPEDGTPGFSPGVSTLRNSGVIEGFYGIPWSWRERRHMVEAAAAQGLDAYLYAPKNDPLHRAKWRDAYPGADMDEFLALARRSADVGVTFLFGISPFIDFDFAGDGDYQALLGKLRPFVQGGVRGVAILGDDIEMEADVTPDTALGKRHAAIVNRLLADLRALAPDVRLWFTPTVYSDQRANDPKWPDARGYLGALADLDPSVEIHWTGTGTGSPSLQASDMAAFRSLAGRKPLIWDNFWANDGGDGMFGRLLLKPYSGRAPDLAGAVSGIAQNLSIQGALSRLTLATFGRWARDPATATLENEILEAVEAEQRFCLGRDRDAARDADTMRFLMAAHTGTGTEEFTHYPAMDDGVTAFRAALKAPGIPGGPATALLAVFGRMAASQSEVHHSGLDPDLVDDAWYPLQAIRTAGEQGLWALALAGERLAGREGAAAGSMLDDLALQAARNRFLFSPGVVDGLVGAVAALPAEARGFEAVGAHQDPPACQAGVEIRWRPFATGDASVFGLPGARVEAGEVAWAPPHAGRYRAVLTAATDRGWAFQLRDLVCTDR